jgi:hypothetical protein
MNLIAVLTVISLAATPCGVGIGGKSSESPLALMIGDDSALGRGGREQISPGKTLSP